MHNNTFFFCNNNKNEDEKNWQKSFSCLSTEPFSTPGGFGGGSPMLQGCLACQVQLEELCSTGGISKLFLKPRLYLTAKQVSPNLLVICCLYFCFPKITPKKNKSFSSKSPQTFKNIILASLKFLFQVTHHQSVHMATGVPVLLTCLLSGQTLVKESIGSK